MTSAQDNPNQPTILVAPMTMFHTDGTFNKSTTQQHAETVCSKAINGCFINGTTGEFLALSLAERNEVAKIFSQTIGDKRGVLHIGDVSLPQVRQHIDTAHKYGYKEVAVITPLFWETSFTTVKDYLTQVAKDAQGLTVYVYLFAARTGVTLTPQQAGELMAIDGIAGAKISGESVETCGEMRRNAPSTATVYTGNDKAIDKALQHNLAGIVSGVGSAEVAPFIAIANKASTDIAVEQLQANVDLAVNTLQGNMRIQKEYLRMQGFPESGTRFPCAPLTQQDHDRLAHLAQTMQQTN